MPEAYHLHLAPRQRHDGRRYQESQNPALRINADPIWNSFLGNGFACYETLRHQASPNLESGHDIQRGQECQAGHGW